MVGELLDMVTLINQRGTAVVLVEQSVNVALSVVDHAYFMEKGTIRFDGNSDELMGRRDLLRSVFLEGAGGRPRHLIRLVCHPHARHTSVFGCSFPKNVPVGSVLILD